MFNIQNETAEFNGQTLTIETGLMGRLANASVVVSMGESQVFVAACSDKMRRDLGFFPLTVDYREKMVAAGKFPGGFIKREGRPTTKEILTCRCIDRPIRPLFPSGMGVEVQVQCIVLSADEHIDPDLLASVGAMAALRISDIPWDGPLGSVRVTRTAEGELVSFPTEAQRKDAQLDMLLSGSADAIVMVEAGAKEISEEQMVEALFFGQQEIAKVIGMIEKLAAKAGKPKFEFTPPEVNTALNKEIEAAYGERWLERLCTPAKKDRSIAVRELRDEIFEKYCPEDVDEPEHDKGDVGEACYQMTRSQMRKLIVEKKSRVDGRALDTIRPIDCRVGFIKRTHGSALFTRGETQACVSLALGTEMDGQRIDGLMEETKENFMLHYQFPPFSVGECRPIRGPGRREIGHGALAQRALQPCLPKMDDFPYTIRLTSDIMESNGSSSMASVCGGSLAMMDAGVPITQPVAGIAMGMIKEGDEIRVISDILGDEDHHGDMDFKVTGSPRGITALQMDCKVSGISREVLSQALEQARVGRLHILKEMLKSIDRPRGEISRFAPRVIRLRIDSEKIGLVIGPGGKVIRKIQEETGADIGIEDDGTVSIYCVSADGAEAAAKWVRELTVEPEVGKIYNGRVTSVKDFGCFVEILPNQEGLVHISELADGFVDKVRDVVKEGDHIDVKVILIDENRRVKLSKKAVDMERNGEKKEPVESK